MRIERYIIHLNTLINHKYLHISPVILIRTCQFVISIILETNKYWKLMCNGTLTSIL